MSQDERRAREMATVNADRVQRALFGTKTSDDHAADVAAKLQARLVVLRAVADHGWYWPSED